MRTLNWYDEYQQMGKPRPTPNKVRLSKIRFALANGEVVVTINKEIKNLLKWQPNKVTLEMIERDDIVSKTYCLPTNKKKNKKRKK